MLKESNKAFPLLSRFKLKKLRLLRTTLVLSLNEQSQNISVKHTGLTPGRMLRTSLRN